MSAAILAGYLADVCILGTYASSVRTGRLRGFHWANALGAVPLLYLEVGAHLWPVCVISGTFGVLGWLGVWRTHGR